MKLKATQYSTSYDKQGNPILHLMIDKGYKWLLNQIPKQDEYSVSLSKYRNSRSLQQNKLMWALLEIMSDEMNGGMTGEGAITSWDCYISMLELSNAKYEIISVRPQAVEFVKKQFRQAKELQRKILLDKEGKKGEYVILKCWIGSSEYDTKEMTLLIDAIINQLLDMGIDARNQEEFGSLKNENENLRR